MNNLKPLAMLLAVLLILPSCKKDNNKEDNSTQPVLLTELLKSVTWNVGVTHKLEFAYNTDGSIKQYTSGSSNIAWQYVAALKYNNQRLSEVIGEGNSGTKYFYDSNNRVSQTSYQNNGTETSRHLYSYNSRGMLAEHKVMVALYGVLSVTEQITYHYNVNNDLTDTQSDWFDETGNKTATVIRTYESWSPEVDINPYSLLHPLYQHQATEVFNPVVLSQLKRLPKKISETGNPEIGPVTYAYKLTSTGKRIDKLKCTISIAGGTPYDTAEAVFHY